MKSATVDFLKREADRLLQRGSRNRRSLAKQMFVKQRGKCFHCSKPFQSNYDITFDHLWPRRGRVPSHKERTNCVLACARCNRERGDQLPTLEEERRFQKTMGYYLIKKGGPKPP